MSVPSPDRQNLLERALVQIEALQKRLAAAESADREPIAVVGVGCRFPGADGPDAFWRLLRAGEDGVSEDAGQRRAGAASPGARWGALQRVDEFDAEFFGISEAEGRKVDPQQRLALEVAWEAIEHGGLTLERLRANATGVFVGVSNSDYLAAQLAAHADVDVYTGMGAALSMVANRLSYALDLRGPSLVLDTACSSSLVAVHSACASLRGRECDVALAGGVNLILSATSTLLTAKILPLAPDGRCKAFDARADGIVRGEGAGMVVLMRLRDAEADGDRILALIRGSAVTHAGRTNGLGAPSLTAQEDVIRRALRRAGVRPEEVTCIEAHGTGTPLGDPIEVEALRGVYGAEGACPCAIGSVKTNLGHLEAAAGIAGLIKMVLALGHGEIPPHLHLRELSPHVNLAGSRLVIPSRLTSWPEAPGGRFAAVSSFGLGGTGVHAILEGPRVQERAEVEAPAGHPLLLPLSARSEAALDASIEQHIRWLTSSDDSLRDICHTATARRTHHPARAFVAGRSRDEIVARLEKLRAARARVPSRRGRRAAPRVAFVFSGQGSHRAGMARGLMAAAGPFRQGLETCDALFGERLGWSLLGALAADQTGERWQRTREAQFAIFAIQVSLVALLRSWGVEPDAVVGHSVGEVAAAHVAGVLTLEQAVVVLTQRARVLESISGRGLMVELALSRSEADALLAGHDDRIAVAAVNGPRRTVISGDGAAVEGLLEPLRRRGVAARRLSVPCAFHSPQTEALVPDLTASLTSLEPRSARLPLYSTVTAGRMEGRELGGSYWARNLAAPVLFQSTVDTLLADGYDVFVEIGPRPVLTASLSDCVAAAGAPAAVVPTLKAGDEAMAVAEAVGALYELGGPLAWPGAPGARVVDLPPYPWQRRRLWFDDAVEAGPRPRPEPTFASAPRPSSMRARLAQAPPERQRGLVVECLLDRLRGVLDPETAMPIHLGQSLESLGLDSLRVVELKNQVEQELDVTLHILNLSPQTSLMEIADLVCVSVGLAAQVHAVADLSADEAGAALSRLHEMSEEEVSGLLRRVLPPGSMA